MKPFCGTWFVVSPADARDGAQEDGQIDECQDLVGRRAACAVALPRNRRARSTQQPASTPGQDVRGRVATTIDGDAGLWWVPIADTNGKKLARGSAARISRNTPQGHMNVANFTAAVSYGFTERVDVFASWDVITRVDRDTRSCSSRPMPSAAASISLAPYARKGWTRQQNRRLRVGAKIAFLSEAAGHPFSAAGRLTVTLPTAKPIRAPARRSCHRHVRRDQQVGHTARSS